MDISESLSETFDLFDEWEPMCSEAPEVFRNEILPQAKQLVCGLVGKGDLDAARALAELFGIIRYFVELNGPALFTTTRKIGSCNERIWTKTSSGGARQNAEPIAVPAYALIELVPFRHAILHIEAV